LARTLITGLWGLISDTRLCGAALSVFCSTGIAWNHEGLDGPQEDEIDSLDVLSPFESLRAIGDWLMGTLKEDGQQHFYCGGT
jgi:hypothetical protein